MTTAPSAKNTSPAWIAAIAIGALGAAGSFYINAEMNQGRFELWPGLTACALNPLCWLGAAGIFFYNSMKCPHCGMHHKRDAYTQAVGSLCKCSNCKNEFIKPSA